MPFPPSAKFPRKSLSVSQGPSILGDKLSTVFPVEIRVEIFRHCCAFFPIDAPFGARGAGPLKLIRVSRSWRDLVLNTPPLWASFSLWVTAPQTNSRLVVALAQCLTRSRGAGLSFIFRYPVLDATCTKLFAQLLAASDRWRAVTLNAPSASLLSLWDLVGLGRGGASFPALRSLSVETVGLPPASVRSLSVSWTQLTKLDLFLIAFPTLDDCLFVLQQAVNLLSCSLNAACILEEEAPHVTLPKVADLKLKLYDGHGTPSLSEDSFHAFLECIECPNMRSFGLKWNLSHGPARLSHTDKLITFLDRQSAHLERLQLSYIPLDTPQLVRLLESVPGLRELRLAHSTIDREGDFINDQFLEALADGASTRLPLLESVAFNSKGECFSNPALLRFITSRWKHRPIAPGSLQHLEINSPKRVAEYTPHWFRDWKEAKLDVRASLKRSPADMLNVLPAFLAKDLDSYETVCFMNCDFPLDIRSLLVFDVQPK
ncbi:hypothetical protein HMN09_00504000 [Mycena chlorophos]|uniref:F-box domain-containing protein n=1 Tax=Mycena chlorophos TaxID=658473 RepID=A0A8H6TB43_MYCCL|nr:hypothetical protein HMN09_00504000 [Mycena chlorophos]